MTGLNAGAKRLSDAEKIEDQILGAPLRIDLKLGLFLNFGQELLINGLE